MSPKKRATEMAQCRDTRSQALKPEFGPQTPLVVRRALAPRSCPSDLPMCPLTCSCPQMHTHTQKINVIKYSVLTLAFLVPRETRCLYLIKHFLLASHAQLFYGFCCF